MCFHRSAPIYKIIIFGVFTNKIFHLRWIVRKTKHYFKITISVHKVAGVTALCWTKVIQQTDVTCRNINSICIACSNSISSYDPWLDHRSKSNEEPIFNSARHGVWCLVKSIKTNIHMIFHLPKTWFPEIKTKTCLWKIRNHHNH